MSEIKTKPTRVGYNGQIKRVAAFITCDVCESGIPSGAGTVAIAYTSKWVYICKPCLETFYKIQFGNN